MLLDARGRIPNDYKIHCFDGEPCFVQVHADRFSDHACSIYDRDFRRLDVELSYPSGEFDRPREWDEMLEVASALSEGLDYIRVDLYWTGDSVYVGEMTPYDAGGLKEFQPDAWDLEWGQRWTLPPGHRVEEERQLGDGVIRS